MAACIIHATSLTNNTLSNSNTQSLFSLSGAGREDYDAFEEVAGMNVATVARELEEASNIKDLEAR